jgi:hypothetical protein
MTAVDVVIPAHPKDFPLLRHCVRSVLRYVEPLGRVYVVASEPFQAKDPRVVWVPESSASSLPTSAQLRERWAQYGPSAAGRAGWIYQQLLKLAVPEYVPDISAAYMLVDADVIWLRPWPIVIDDRIRFPYTHASEYHAPYRDAYFRLFGVRPQAPFSLTAHQMVYDRDLLAQMKRAIESLHGVAWWDAYVHAADPLEPSSISELDIYGFWVLDNHPDAASHRPLSYLNVPIVPGPLGRAVYARDFNFVAAHAYMRAPRWLRAAQIGGWMARDALAGTGSAGVSCAARVRNRARALAGRPWSRLR